MIFKINLKKLNVSADLLLIEMFFLPNNSNSQFHSIIEIDGHFMQYSHINICKSQSYCYTLKLLTFSQFIKLRPQQHTPHTYIHNYTLKHILAHSWKCHLTMWVFVGFCNVLKSFWNSCAYFTFRLSDSSFSLHVWKYTS